MLEQRFNKLLSVLLILFANKILKFIHAFLIVMDVVVAFKFRSEVIPYTYFICR